jgi:hypothetical protein
MTLFFKIRDENGGVFPSHLDGSQKLTKLGRIRGFDFRLTIEGKFDWYSFCIPCLVSTICIREYSNVWTSLQTVQYWMCEMHRISAVITSLVIKIRAENGGVFPSHLDGSQKLTELGRIRGFDFRLAIEGKFDWYSLDKPCLFQRYVFGRIRTFEPRSKRFNIGCVKLIELARFPHHFERMNLVCTIMA